MVLAQDGYSLGLIGRRPHLLKELKESLSTPVLTQQIDVADHDKAMDLSAGLIEQMGGVELVVISAGSASSTRPELVRGESGH